MEIEKDPGRKGGISPMRIKTIAFFVAAGLIALAPQAYAMGGGGGGRGGDSSGTFSGHFSGNDGEGTWTDSNGNSGTFSGTYTEHGGDNGTPTSSAAEPLTLLAVGAGLLGARCLRRR
jgi:hypothetical protein